MSQYKRKIKVRPILHLVGKTRVKIITDKQAFYPRYETGTFQAFSEHGHMLFESLPKRLIFGKKKNFIIRPTTQSLEGHASIALDTATPQKGITGRIGQISLGFTKNKIYIEAIQGKPNTQSLGDQARTAIGMHWPNKLIKIVEDAAKTQGFTEIRIRVPESLYSYHHPSTKIFEEATTFLEKRKVLAEHRAQMRALYETVAEKMGYKRRGLVYIKKL